MRLQRTVLLVAACLAVARFASADDIHIIFDPQPPTSGDYYLIEQQGVDYDVSWESCGDSAFFGTGLTGDSACLAFINKTGANIASLDLSFTVNSALVGQTITCTNSDGSLTSNNCASFAPLTLNESVTMNFTGGEAIPNEMAFYFGEDGVSLSDMPTSGVVAPEPPTLLLAGLGVLGLLWVLGGQVKKRRLISLANSCRQIPPAAS